MSDAQSMGRDDRIGSAVSAAFSPARERRRFFVSRVRRLGFLAASLLLAAAYTLFGARPSSVGGPDLRLRELLDRIEGMALVVPGAEQTALEPYFLDRFEVTNEEFARYLGQAGTTTQDWPPDALLPSAIRVAKERASEPVVFVSQPDAKAYAAHHGKRLPSVLEWSYAAGLGANSDWDTLSRYRMNLLETGLGRPARVGTFEGGRTRASDRIAPAVYDLIGNVAEWCGDEPDSTGITPSAPVMGGSFNDSLLDARARFAQDTASVDDRNFALGFRCVRADAEGWLREFGNEVAASHGQLRREHVDRLRRLGVPLGRLIERARLRDATRRSWLAGARVDVSDRYAVLADGVVLRFHEDRVERLDLEAGVIAHSEVVGVGRELARTLRPNDSRAYWRVAESRTRATASTLWLTRSPGGRFEWTSDRFESIPEAATAEDSALPIVPVPSDFLPSCLLTAPCRWLPVPLSVSSTRNRLIEIEPTNSGLTIRQVASLPAVDEVVVAPERGTLYTRDSIVLQIPEYSLPIMAVGAGLTVVTAFSTTNGEKLGSVAIPSSSIAMQPSSVASDRVILATDYACIRIENLFAAIPTARTSIRFDRDAVRIVEASAFQDRGMVLEVRDDASQLAYLMRVDSDAGLVASRRLDTFDVRTSRVAVVDSDTLLLLGADDSLICLDGALDERWTARGAPYTFEFCPPVALDLDRDGTTEFAVPFGREGVFGVVCHDTTSGREVERITTQGHLVLALLAPKRPLEHHHLLVAVRELGLLELKAPQGPQEQVLRELEQALGRGGRKARSP